MRIRRVRARREWSIWQGRWQETVERKETPYGHAGTSRSRTTCVWTADRGYVVCEYFSEKTRVDEAGGRVQ